MGVKPDPKITTLVKGNKFDSKTLEIIEVKDDAGWISEGAEEGWEGEETDSEEESGGRRGRE